MKSRDISLGIAGLGQGGDEGIIGHIQKKKIKGSVKKGQLLAGGMSNQRNRSVGTVGLKKKTSRKIIEVWAEEGWVHSHEGRKFGGGARSEQGGDQTKKTR